jgi:uncharacterized protein
VRIHLDRVQQAPFAWDETVEIAAESLEREELVGLGPVRWQGRVSYADPDCLLRARVDYEQTLVCDRCLKPFTVPAGSEVELLLVVEEGGRGDAGDEVELQEEDLGVVYLDSEELDPRPLLVDQLQLNVPMKPLCREDCQGLCPRCGADWNEGRCDCAEEGGDPRWAALAALRDRMPEDR